MDKFKNCSTLQLIQSTSTIPSAFPRKMNTCGRVCVHQSGHFVIVSNRGHESLAIFRVIQGGMKRGHLKPIGFFHTRGETPRHFQFDNSGQYLVVANQDSNSIAVFSFNLSSGEIKYTGNEYRVPSPNFVCCCPLLDDGAPLTRDDLSLSEKSVDSVEEYQVSNSVISGSKHLAMELEMARLEISELKRKLSSLTTQEDDSSFAVVDANKTLGHKISALTEDSNY